MDGGALTIVGIKRVRLRGFVVGFINDVRFGCEIWPAEKNVDVIQAFFFGNDVTGSFTGGCLRLVIFLIVSHELTRSGNSTGSSGAFDCGIYQSFVDVWDRRILTLSFWSIELEFDDEDEEEEEEEDVAGFSFSGTSICKGVCSETSILDGTGCFTWRIRFRIVL